MKRLAILSGAGVSKESGLNTFRDNDGMWEQYRVEDVASIEGWYRDRGVVLDFYNQRRRALKNALPNKAHTIIAQLEPFFDTTIITQNIDNLHERGGSSKVIHLHGELTKAIEEDNKYKVYDIGYNDINLGDKGENGVQLRPFIVWFGESVPKIEEAIDIVSKCDILLVIGTSLVVYPAAGIIRYVKKDTAIYMIDPADININIPSFTHIKEIATTGMERFRNILLNNYQVI